MLQYCRQAPAAYKVVGVGNAAGGTVHLDPVTQKITFVPDQGFVELASFTYDLLTAGSPQTSRATVTVEVDPAKPASLPTDELSGAQWYLYNVGQTGATPGNDMNVAPVWNDYDGTGGTANFIETGLDWRHPDIVGNYDSTRDVDYTGGDNDSAAAFAEKNHATATVGIFGAGSNGSGVVGVAYGADVTVSRSESGTYSNTHYAGLAFRDTAYRFDVVNHFLAANSFEQRFDDPQWANMREGYLRAVSMGRSGLGTIILRTAGNNRETGQDANRGEFHNSRFAALVGGATFDGGPAYFTNAGEALLVSAAGQGMPTTDRLGAAGYNSSDYYADFGGTCGAVAAASGSVALILDADANLGFRDVREILALSARRTSGATGWSDNAAGILNGGGLHFSRDLGFGLIDTLAAVRLAETWMLQQTYANEVSASATWSGNRAIGDGGPVTTSLTIANDLELDHVGVTLDIDHQSLGDLIVTMRSLSGI